MPSLPYIARFRLLPNSVKVGLEIARLLRERELDEIPQRGFHEEAKKERGSSTKAVTSCDNVERPHVVWGRGKRVISRPTLRYIKADGNFSISKQRGRKAFNKIQTVALYSDVARNSKD
ncbi:hypothetical protein GCM10011389_34810 [Pontibacillus salipaludis]|uniref:Uncharacterized protein n=1 Tax=Pontibacillus salipaludis TaxID=1697394 RepID=A0ABQ1QF67_9BACI|nr:hypothetical protein GCM10011389_34810 [Pontibacillus salipaludis]